MQLNSEVGVDGDSRRSSAVCQSLGLSERAWLQQSGMARRRIRISPPLIFCLCRVFLLSSRVSSGSEAGTDGLQLQEFKGLGHKLTLKSNDARGELLIPDKDAFNRRAGQLNFMRTSHYAVQKARNVRSANSEDQTVSNLDYCHYSFDAAANIRNELFFMKGNQFWRIRQQQHDLSNINGMDMSLFWKDFPNVNVGAAFTNPNGQQIIFVSENSYWEYSNPSNKSPQFNQSTCNFGLCDQEIRAAVVWGANQQVYLFGNGKFWRLDNNLKVEIGYPINISKLRGVPSDLDAAVKDFDGNVYFIKGKKYWKLDNDKLAVTSNPGYIGAKWFGCNESQYEVKPTASTFQNNVGGRNGAMICKKMCVPWSFTALTFLLSLEITCELLFF